MIDKMSDTTRLIDRMIKRGWVKKNTCPEDKRLVDIVITDLGLAKLEEIENNPTEKVDILKSLSEEETLQLSNLLDKLRDYKDS